MPIQQKAFFPQFNDLCLRWCTPGPGMVTTYGGPLRAAEIDFCAELDVAKRSLFEQLLLFDSVQLNVTGPNLIGPLMYEFMGGKALEDLLDQSAISFVVWQPQPLLGHKDGRVTATFTGSLGDGKGSEFDIERIVEDGLRLHPVDMPASYRNTLARKLTNVHSLIDPRLPDSAWKITEDALKAGELADLGLPATETSIGLPASEGELLVRAAESLMHYRYVMQNGMVCQNSAGVFDLLRIGLHNLQQRHNPVGKFATLAQFERFPNLRRLSEEIEHPFRRIARFRRTHTAKRFREWLSTTPSSDIELIREYVNECANRKGLFESAPAKFLKVASMVALANYGGTEALAAGALLMNSVPPAAIAEALRFSAEFGTGVVDSFLIENLKVGWTPRAYFDGLRRLYRRDPP
jgi:hypothetical protein